MPRKRERQSVADVRRLLACERPSATVLRRYARDPRQGVQQLVALARRRIRRNKAEQQRLRGLLSYELECWETHREHVAGVDEVGAGPLAGPIVAAAVVLPSSMGDHLECLHGLDDSKKMSRPARERLAGVLFENALAWSVGYCTPQEIDRLNILQAGREAMRRAVVALSFPCDAILVDARSIPDITTPQRSIKGGDGVSLSIAAASVIAKVTRDAWMEAYGALYPGYGLEQNRGYPTEGHLFALEAQGPSPIHRRSFAPVRAAEAAS